MRRIVIIAALAASPFAFADGPDVSKVNGSVRAEAGQQYGDIDTVNGSIMIGRGARAETVETVNGGIDVDDQAVIESIEAVNGAIEIGEAVEISDDVSTVNGGIEVGRASRIGGAVETVNGRIEIEATEVGKRISTVNGDITVGADSIVRGGILVEKPKGSGSWFNWGGKPRTPRVVIGANAIVEGTLEFQREVELFVHDSATIGEVKGATAQRYSGERP